MSDFQKCEWCEKTGVDIVGYPRVCQVCFERMMRERDDARGVARVLAHAYTHDSRPPQAEVDKALAYPIGKLKCLLCAGSHEDPPYRVGHRRGSCEWYPDDDRAANCSDPWHAQATVIVGANGNWRLCASCAALPRFARFKKRRKP